MRICQTWGSHIEARGRHYSMATLSKANIPFQAQVLAWILQETSALAQLRNSIDTAFWQNPVHHNIARAVYEYYDVYEGVPSENTLRAIIDDRLSANDSDMATFLEYSETIDALCHGLLKDESEKEFLKANLESLIRKRLTDMALVNGVTMAGEGNFDGLSDLVSEATNFRLNKDDRHVKWSAFDRQQYLDSVKTAPVSTGFSSMDDELHGGLHPGELGIICGVAGTGKSQLLVNLSANAMHQGKKVLLVTLEMSEREINKRLDACISEEEYWALSSNATANAVAQAKLQAWRDEHGGDCDIRYYPNQTLTVPQLKAYLKKWYSNEPLPDVIMVDYADQFLPTTDYKNSYDNQGMVYTQLVALAGHLNIPIWTASQSNREGKKAKTIQLEHLADSWKKACVANVVYTINQDENEVKNQMLRLYSVKVRNGEKNRFHYFKTEFHKSRLVQVSEVTYEGYKQDPNYGGGQQMDMNKNVGNKGWSSNKMMGYLKLA